MLEALAIVLLLLIIARWLGSLGLRAGGLLLVLVGLLSIAGFRAPGAGIAAVLLGRVA